MPGDNSRADPGELHIEDCPGCDGSGYLDEAEEEQCEDCHGQGWVAVDDEPEPEPAWGWPDDEDDDEEADTDLRAAADPLL